ncbi:17027_t:CDS:2, partial [Funneliformis geosporum]
MGRRQHFLTPYVVVLHAAKKANKSNKYAVCRACISIIGKDEAYRLKFANTKKECARHIKNCQSFAQKYSSQQIAKLLDDATKDGMNDSDSDIDNRELEISVANISNLPHPARDQNAKWRLRDIFIESLGEPNYLPNFML